MDSTVAPVSAKLVGSLLRNLMRYIPCLKLSSHLCGRRWLDEARPACSARPRAAYSLGLCRLPCFAPPSPPNHTCRDKTKPGKWEVGGPQGESIGTPVVLESLARDGSGRGGAPPLFQRYLSTSSNITNLLANCKRQYLGLQHYRIDEWVCLS